MYSNNNDDNNDDDNDDVNHNDDDDDDYNDNNKNRLITHKLEDFRLKISRLVSRDRDRSSKWPPPRGGTSLYGLYRYVWPQRVGFFSHFGHK